MPPRPVIYPVPVRIRHIKRGTGPGAVPILGESFEPSWAGINGPSGFVSGQYELRLNEEGRFTVTFPNTAGDDGVLHRDRFLIVSQGKRIPGFGANSRSIVYSGGNYRPGDEWIEFWWGEPGECVFVGVPTKADLTSAQLTITGYDAWWLLRKSRETATGFWHHAPRDVFNHYTSIWRSVINDHFAGATMFGYSASNQASSDGKWLYKRIANTGARVGREGTVRMYPGAINLSSQLIGKEAFFAGWSNFQDDFNDDSIDENKWVPTEDVGVTMFEQNGRIEIAQDGTSASSQYGLLTTQDRYDMRSREASVEVVQPGAPESDTEVYVRLQIDADNAVMTIIGNGQVFAYKAIGGTYTSLGGAGVVPRWIRVRESMGYTYWDYSSDRITWTNIASALNPINLSSVEIQIGAGRYDTGPGNFMILDNFSLGGDTLPSWRMEASFTRSPLFSSTDSLRVGVMNPVTNNQQAAETPPLSDNFDDGVIHSQWTQAFHANGPASETGGQFQVVHNGAIGYSALYSPNRDMRNMQTTIQLHTKVLTGGYQIFMRWQSPVGSNWIDWFWDGGGTMNGTTAIGGVATTVVTSTVSPTHIRMREVNGTLYYETSIDNEATWVTKGSVATPSFADYVSISFHIGRGVAGTGGTTKLDNFVIGPSVDGVEVCYVAVGSAPGSPIDAGLDREPPGPFRIALEGHGRYIYCFANGRFVGHMPGQDCHLVPYVIFTRGADSFTGIAAGEAWVDVEFITLRRTVPFLTRGSVRGDDTLPGVPPPDGLVASYYDDNDLKSEVSDASFEDRVLAPTRIPYATRVEPGICGTTDVAGSGSWQPSGPSASTNFSASWKGSIYLQLENYDYNFRSLVDDRFRLWIGNTRRGDELINDWTVGHPPTVTGTGWLRSELHFPAVSGWYPFVAEFSQGVGYSMAVLQCVRSDLTSLWFCPGEGGYPQLVAASSPSSYWRLNDFLVADGVCADHMGGVNGLYTSLGATGQAYYRASYLQPLLAAPNFDGVDAHVNLGDNYDFAGTAAFSTEFWVMFDNIAAPWKPCVSKQSNVNEATTNGWSVFLAPGPPATMAAQRRAAATITTVTNPTSITTGIWYHVACTYDGTNMILYVNGVAGPTAASAHSLAGHADPLYIGRWPPLMHSGPYLNGSIAEVAIWNRALSASEVQSHYAASNFLNQAVKYSPLGVYENLVRYDTHYDVLKGLIDQYNYQATLEPRSLESGEFPGRLVPEIRVGRDTDKILSPLESFGTQLAINAEDVCDTLLADAAGLADVNQGAQLTAESVNFEELGDHLIIAQEYISLADISLPTLFQQRLDSMMALRGSVWEEVSTTPVGSRELTDSWPLTGELAEFAWKPGDSIRLQLDDIGIRDDLPRQILGVTRNFVPGGMTDIAASFRQRPRNLIEMFRHIQRTALAQIRNYQGQIASASGTLGSATAADPYTRVVLPIDLRQVIQAYFVVTTKSDASTWNVEINATNRFTITGVGRYDVRAYVGPYAATDKRMAARLLGGTGIAEYHLELLISI